MEPLAHLGLAFHVLQRSGFAAQAGVVPCQEPGSRCTKVTQPWLCDTYATQHPLTVATEGSSFLSSLIHPHQRLTTSKASQDLGFTGFTRGPDPDPA